MCGEIGVSDRSCTRVHEGIFDLVVVGYFRSAGGCYACGCFHVVERILNALYVFSFDGQEVIGVKNDVFGDDIEDQDHIDTVRDFIVGACSMPSASDALFILMTLSAEVLSNCNLLETRCLFGVSSVAKMGRRLFRLLRVFIPKKTLISLCGSGRS